MSWMSRRSTVPCENLRESSKSGRISFTFASWTTNAVSTMARNEKQFLLFGLCRTEMELPTSDFGATGFRGTLFPGLDLFDRGLIGNRDEMGQLMHSFRLYRTSFVQSNAFNRPTKESCLLFNGSGRIRSRIVAIPSCRKLSRTLEKLHRFEPLPTISHKKYSD